MTRDQIIEQLFTGRNFREAIEKMEPAHLREDLRMEVIAEVCEWTDEKILDLYNRRRLDFYVAKVIFYMLINKYSPFFKKYRVGVVEYNEGTDGWADGGFIEGSLRDEWVENRNDHKRGQWRTGVAVEVDDIQTREIRELKEDQAIGLIGDLYWYDQQLIKLYIQHGTYRAIEAETGIPWESAYKSIQKSLKHIRCQVTKLSSTPS